MRKVSGAKLRRQVGLRMPNVQNKVPAEAQSSAPEGLEAAQAQAVAIRPELLLSSSSSSFFFFI